MNIAEARAHEKKINAQLHEAKALLNEVEAHAKKNKAQAEIDKISALKTKKQEIEKKFQHYLKTAGGAALVLKVRDEIEPDLAKLKGSLQEVTERLASQSAAK